MMLFQWLFGKKSAEPHIQDVWSAVQAKRLMFDVESIIARTVAEYARKVDVLNHAEEFSDDQLRKKLRRLYKIEKKLLKYESFEDKRLDKAIHHLLDSIEREKSEHGKEAILEFEQLKNKLLQWHDNLVAQISWLSSHPTISEIRENLDALKHLIRQEGEVLFDVKEKQLPELVKNIDALIALAEYPPQSKIQYMQYKERLRRSEWWQKQRGDVAILYHASDQPVLLQGRLNPKGRSGFFMARTPEEAVEAVEHARAVEKLSVYRVIINRKVAERLIVVVGAAREYFMIPLELFPQADKEIKREFIHFEKL